MTLTVPKGEYKERQQFVADFIAYLQEGRQITSVEESKEPTEFWSSFPGIPFNNTPTWN